MAYRRPEKQTIHDRKVKEIADSYNARAWLVKADLAGYDKPDTINGYIPDVQATLSNKWEEIIEVETQDSLQADREQQAAFQKYAAGKAFTDFKLVMAD